MDFILFFEVFRPKWTLVRAALVVIDFIGCLFTKKNCDTLKSSSIFSYQNMGVDERRLWGKTPAMERMKPLSEKGNDIIRRQLYIDLKGVKIGRKNLSPIKRSKQ